MTYSPRKVLSFRAEAIAEAERSLPETEVDFSIPLVPRFSRNDKITMTIYSSIPNTTSALFQIKRDFSVREGEKFIIFTDEKKTATHIENVGGFILENPITSLSHASELFYIERIKTPYILVDSSIFRIEGNLESIRRSHTITMKRGEKYSQNLLIEKLLDLGYAQSDYRGELGTYKRDGSVIRVTSGESEWVIEYFDDEIESIMEYVGDIHAHHDSVTFGRQGGSNSYPLLLPLKGGESGTPPLLGEAGRGIGINLELLSLITTHPLILLSCEFSQEREYLHEHGQKVTEYSSLEREGSAKLDTSRISLETVEELKAFLEGEKKSEIHIVTRYEKRVREFLDMNGFGDLKVTIFRHGLESFIDKSANQQISTPTILLADDVLGRIFILNRVRKSSIKHLDLLLSIKEGDLVVHREHGIGRYISLVKKRIGLTEREYMEVEYAGNDRVYVPLTELGRITKYVGESGTELTRLEGKEWERTLSKTDEEVARIAEEILETDAKRKLTKRIPFAKFREEEEHFLRSFKYTHTPDQLSIIREIQEDMEGEHPMDRLISGDVGFGKTEVAMHAIYKAVLNGMQVAVISPLLILAEEHRETFEERLGAFGVRVASLTRMTKPKEEKEILRKMKTGELDVIVGTHRLLSEDIGFRRLGVLVIDEEHRFGVGHKEAIKKMKAHIDILSLSATPIPRSLNLALSGLKKISLLTTPPPAKKPIETIISRWDEGMIKNAIESELARDGQVIILHNRIRALPMIEREIEQLLENCTFCHSEGNGGTPFSGTYENKGNQNLKGGKQKGSPLRGLPSGAIRDDKIKPRIITTHGQMKPDEIEDRIYDFKHGKYDILLTTTVIENGVNFLGANTIIISDAEEFGLAQLHQIRGRVGRKDVGGTCYLMYRKYELSSEERERLMILAEHSYLGSGYEIAMRDMQMRGTGDILGFRQSGKSKEVGISLYFQLLEEKVNYLKSGKKESELTKIELDLSYAVPDEYFDSDIDKLSFFREIESIDTLEDLDRAEEVYLERNIVSEQRIDGVRGGNGAKIKNRESDVQHQVATPRLLDTFGHKSIRNQTGIAERDPPSEDDKNGVGESQDSPLSNLFLMTRASIILRQYSVTKVSKVGTNYHFDFTDGTTPATLRAFLDRFDSGKEMIIVSIKKIRVETRNWSDARGFLEWLTR